MSHRLVWIAGIILSFHLFSSLSAAETESPPLRFAPLPMEDEKLLNEAFYGFVRYLSAQTGRAIQVVHFVDYADLLKSFGAGEIDLAYLGPLPYAVISQRFKKITPIACFREQDGESRYTCSLVAYGESDIDLSAPGAVHIGLTQPYSTCGYLAVSQMLASVGQDLGRPPISFSYAGSHTEAALGVVQGRYDLAGVKTAVANHYRHLNLKTLAVSRPFPGFGLFANNETVDGATILRLRDALLRLDPRHIEADRQLVSSWGESLRNGAVVAEQCDYSGVIDAMQQLPWPIPGTAP
jgi:phosphonate transport system substrate-binding protein